ncbi:MAG: hypothetical protein JWN76_1172 [Chitinophagaceae bacterium]|nr:hypothetical protein [Chitinophagaceae bacterium]
MTYKIIFSNNKVATVVESFSKPEQIYKHEGYLIYAIVEAATIQEAYYKGRFMTEYQLNERKKSLI